MKLIYPQNRVPKKGINASQINLRPTKFKIQNPFTNLGEQTFPEILALFRKGKGRYTAGIY